MNERKDLISPAVTALATEQYARRTEPSHDYPACAIFRGGKCTCDEAEHICPECGHDERDRITDRTAPGNTFNRCGRCGHEWEAA